MFLEATRRSDQEQENRLRATQEFTKYHQQVAEERVKLMSVATAAAREWMAPFLEAEEKARSELQAMLDRKRFLAEVAGEVRVDVEEAQGILDEFKASAGFQSS